MLILADVIHVQHQMFVYFQNFILKIFHYVLFYVWINIKAFSIMKQKKLK